MSIPAIGALTSATDPNALMAVTSTGLITPPAGGGTVSDSTFGQMLTNSIDNLQGLQENLKDSPSKRSPEIWMTFTTTPSPRQKRK